MPDVTMGDVQPMRVPAETRAVRPREYLVVDDHPETGERLKYFSRTADVDYWTALWEAEPSVSYAREERGHLPHQLRGIVNRWIPSGARVLEAGCGLGHFTVAAAARGYQAEGFDWSERTILRLRRRFPEIPWLIGDVRHIEAAPGTFDAVYSPGVCEHFEDGPGAVLVETHRVLRPGGIAIVSTPCFNSWLQRRAGRLTSSVPQGSSFYQYAFTPAGMAQLLGRLGFEVLEVRPYAALDTLVRYGGWRVPAALTGALAFSMDYLPVVRQWGSTCIWVARKC